MEYIKVQWVHNASGYPILLYSELDDSRFETRKVEIFPDHSIGWAGPSASKGDTRLGEKPVPPIEETALDKEFRPEIISADLFESIWRSRFKTNLPD